MLNTSVVITKTTFDLRNDASRLLTVLAKINFQDTLTTGAHFTKRYKILLANFKRHVLVKW